MGVLYNDVREKKMKKLILILLLICVITVPVFAAKKKKPVNNVDTSLSSDIKFRDVPDSHWAAKAVYKLVELGVTQGYPDGTFRGNKSMTRFETATFLAKLSENLGTAGVEKLGAELKSEIRSIKDDLESKATGIISGMYEAKYYIGNLLASDSNGNKAPSGPVLSYRLRSTLSADISDNANLKINLDTMDGGFLGGSEDLLTKLLDMQATVKLDSPFPMTVVTTVGPGPQQYLTNSPVMPSQYGVTYMRPYNSLGVFTKAYSADLGISYIAHNISGIGSVTPGQINVSEYKGFVTIGFSNLVLLNKGSVSLVGDYFKQNDATSSTGLSNFKPKITVVSDPSEKVELSATIGAGSLHDITTSKMLISSDMKLKEFLDPGTALDIGIVLAGSQYLVEPTQLDEWVLIGLDPFDRPMTNSVRSLHATIKHDIADSLSLNWRSAIFLSPDYRYGSGKANSKMTYELGLNWGKTQDAVITAAYRIETDPNAAVQTSDLLMLGMACKF